MSRMTDYCDVVCDTAGCGEWVETGQRTLADARRGLRKAYVRGTTWSNWTTSKGKDYCPACSYKRKQA